MQMDIVFPVNDVNSLHGFCKDTLGSSYGPVGDSSVDELAYGATKLLNIRDDVERVSGPHEKGGIQMKEECLEAHQSEIITKAHEHDDDDDVITSKVITHDDNVKSIKSHCSSASYVPNRSKPVSAMKGSREKRGLTPPKQLTVKWAPDVYDPVPTLSLHMVINNRPRKHGKKKSKSKQKNGSKSKSSRGSKGEDKKQVGKNTGFNLSELKDEVAHVSEIHKPSAIDFHLGFPDLFKWG